MASEQQWREAVLAIADEYAAAAQWRETPEPGDGHVAHTVRVIESDLRRVIESDLRAMMTRLDRPDAATLREQILSAIAYTGCIHTDDESWREWCSHCEQQGDAVMAVLAEHGLTEREASSDAR